MTDERALTVQVLAAAVRELAPAVRELNRRQRRAAHVRSGSFAFVEHEMTGPPKELRIWPSEQDVVYRFDRQFFGDGTDVETADTTLGYTLYVMRFYTEYNPLARVVFGARRTLRERRVYSRSPNEATPVRLLVVDDGVPALFHDRNRYSGDVPGWEEVLQDIGWAELRP